MTTPSGPATAPTWRMTPISELRHDDDNLRVHDERNHEVVRNSLERFGQVQVLVVQRETGVVIGGNCTLDELIALGYEEVMVCEVDVDGRDARELAFVLNRSAELAGWRDDIGDELAGLRDDGADLASLGVDDVELASYLGEDDGTTVREHQRNRPTDGDDDTPEIVKTIESVRGQVYQLGRHRLMCGDSTNREDVEKLMQEDEARQMHADPPYGMGKDDEGVTNDNLRGKRLDDFQTAWWVAWRPSLYDNGSAYIWGNAPDLWRWYYGWLEDSEPELNARNEIVWAKDSAQGMRDPSARSFVTASERCLFVMLRKQSMGSLNKDEFPESFEPLRAYLDGEREKMGWGPKDTREITGSHMHGHWFGRSQWCLPSEERYAQLQGAADGAAFLRPYAELRAEYEGTGREDIESARGAFRAGRGFFDNTHEAMHDVWDYPRVTGAERQGHPTPKPVAMVQRTLHSSSQPGDVIAVPFGGSGPELIACEKSGRSARIMELEPQWCDAIRRRWGNWCRRNDIDPGPDAL